MLYRKRGRSRLWCWKITVWRDEITGTKMQVLFSWHWKRGTNSYMHHAEVWISEMRNFQLGKKSIPRSIKLFSLLGMIWSCTGRWRDGDDLVVVPSHWHWCKNGHGQGWHIVHLRLTSSSGPALCFHLPVMRGKQATCWYLFPFSFQAFAQCSLLAAAAPWGL